MRSTLTLSLLAGIAFSVAAQGVLAANEATSSLESQVKITKKQARQLALDRSPEGTVKSEKLEQHGDQRVWVVNVARYDKPQYVTTVMVDADTGKVSSGTPHAPPKSK